MDSATKMEIIPNGKPGKYRTGTIHASWEEIEQRLGFAPNVQDDPNKVGKSWGFWADGMACSVWSYYGSGDRGRFSTYGPHEKLREIFGDSYEKDQ